MKPLIISADEINQALTEAGHEFRRTGNSNGAFINALRKQGYQLSQTGNGVSVLAPVPHIYDHNNQWPMPSWIVPITNN